MKRFIHIMASLFVLVIFARVNAHADSATITPEDRGAIIDLIAHYGHTFDRRDGEGMANLFTDDGEWLAFPKPAHPNDRKNLIGDGSHDDSQRGASRRSRLGLSYRHRRTRKKP